MKLQKFPQSCVLIESSNTKILVDPGKLKFENEFLESWKTANAILVTHKHSDHIHAEALTKLNKKIYSSSEVAKTFPKLNFNIVKCGDMFTIGELKIEVSKAVHGYNPRLKGAGEVYENIGYIIDDGKTKLYITSDTICFNNDYKADVVMAPITGFGLTMSAFETALFTKETGAKLLLISHLDNSTYPCDLESAKIILKEQQVSYNVLAINETLEL